MLISGFQNRLDDIFNRLAVGYEGDGPEHAISTDSGNLYVRAISDSTMLGYYDHNVNVPLDVAVRLCRPEALCSRDNPVFAPLLHSCTVVKSFAPGDLVCSLQFAEQMVAMLQLLMPTNKNPKKWVGQGENLFRMIFRRDFPCLGDASLVVMDLESGAGDWGISITKTEDDSVSRIREIFDFKRMPSWLVQQMRRFELKLFDFPARLEAAAAQTHQSLENACGFMVVALKQCCRGLPLLPLIDEDRSAPEDVSWIPQNDSDAFGFSSYLHRVLRPCGLDPEGISDRLDGRQVVHFQAVVNRETWHRLWQTLEPLFKKQRAAYRRRYGGSGAPQIQVDVAPRFCTEQTSSLEHTRWIASDDDDELPVKNTFIQFTASQCQFETGSSN